MQPALRPPLATPGMQTPGGPPPMASGLPNPQRPPAGYRPTHPGGIIPGANPMGGMGDPTSKPVMRTVPPSGPPVLKMASMNLNSSATSQEQGIPSNLFPTMSNGMPETSSPQSSSSFQTFSNSSAHNNNFNAGPPNSNNNQPLSGQLNSQASNLPSNAFYSSSDQSHHQISDNFQDPFNNQSSQIRKNSRTARVSPSQSPSIRAAHSVSSPSLVMPPNVNSPSGTGISSQPSNPYSSRDSSPVVSSDSSSIPQNIHSTGPSISSTATSHSYTTGPSQSSLFPTRSSLAPQYGGPSQSHGLPIASGSPLPPANSPMGPARTGMPPTNTYTASPRPGVPSAGPHMLPPQPGMQPGLQMCPPRQGFTPLNSQMMAQHPPGMPPNSMHMMPQRPGMHTSFPMNSPGTGMPPMSASSGFPRPGMPPPASPNVAAGIPPNATMGPPRLGMPPPNSSMMPPPNSSMMPPPNSSMMPPHNSNMVPSPNSNMMPSPNSNMMPSPNSNMISPNPNMPPSSSTANSPYNQYSSPQMGGMQNRYPGSGTGPATANNAMGAYPQSQGRRLDPDDMPSPLQVMDEDRQCKSGEFFTNLKGGVPPLVTTDFIVKDGGNAAPHFIRSTMYNVPATPDMMKQASIPFGLAICPLAECHPDEAPIYLGTSLTNGPVRCNRCKAYMSPFMMFMDGGRRFQCLFCKQINEVPADYYCHMDSQGARADKFQRPELCLGTYEFIATAEYCKDKLLPKEPAFIFVMEMSQMMVQRGIINILCQNMKSILEHLPKDEIPGQEEPVKSSVHVGFITYDSSVHFYKLTGLAPEMCIVCDKEDMFVPVPDGVLCDVEDVASNIEKLMECIPQNFQTTRETSGSFSCAIQAGMSALKASGRAGKLFVFHSSLPQCEGIGKLKNREDRKLLGTDKEKSILSPQTTHYNNLAQDLVSVGCGVDLYLFNETYIDLATIGQVARLTGGQCHKYTFFQPNKDTQRLLEDIKINLSRDIAFDSVMRVRTSTGVRPVEFYGHFFMSNTHDIELAIVDSSKAIAVEVKHDDKITEEDGVYIQAALLYTSVSGQRRLRIINLSLNICTQMADLYKNCELDVLMNFFGKQSMFKFLETSAKQVKENLIARTAQILACYRKNCASPSSAGQLILPEMMKLLPLYINCLTKCDALSGGQDLTCDDRSWHIYQLCTMTVDASVVYFYPRLIPLSNADPEGTDIPPAVRTSYEKLSPDGVFLLENGLFMFMWVGSGTSSTWMNEVFGVSAPHQLDPVLAELPELNNPTSIRVRNIIEAVRIQRRSHVRLFVVPQQGKHEVVMRNYLVEDKGMFGTPSYVDFLCHVHKEIRAILS